MKRPLTSPRLAVLPMQPGHITEIAAIEAASFACPWPRHFFQAAILHKKAHPLVCLALPGRALTGYLCLWLEGSEVQVQNLAVHPAFRGRGVGAHLLQEGLKQALKLGAGQAVLEVRPSNLAARRLYSSMRFSEIGRKPGYYTNDGEDALILFLDLKNTFQPRTID